ncbi:hypothetical protein POM88_012366 [Heracleum sosnowskyi]|uniref:PGG domain-containing protein n=1 Tax=Heracleum sosnowskyi TaxID=360622 RepID=A0AAD8J080_9APIA|nr:hypothetical protein POM88_012366 [Heracleum sosnowskyi]
MTIPWWNKIKKEYRRYEAATQLCFILVEKDTKWIEMISADKSITTSASYINDADADSADYAASATEADMQIADAYVDHSSVPSNYNNGDANTIKVSGAATRTNSAAAKESVKPPTPLVLATKYGCLEIACKIIEQHPQTVEQVGPEHGTILHLAIKYRRLEIFNAVVNMEMQMRRLVRLRDQDGNSILHMVALNTPKVKVKDGDNATLCDKSKSNSILPWEAEELNDETRSPAFELQDDLLLFEHVEEILKTHYHKTLNNDFQTADRLFAANKEPLRDAAQEWMKRTAENCSIVAVLIATVAFAAAYTVPGPGGSNSDGSPETLPKSLMFGISCLIFSLTMMMLAFAATIILMIKNRQQWTRIALYAVAFLPVSVLVATYLPFYVPLMRTFHYTVDKVKSLLPRFHVRNVDINKLSFSKTRKPTSSSDHIFQV